VTPYRLHLTPENRLRFSVIVLCAFFLGASAALFLGSYSFDELWVGERLATSSTAHLFGVDSFGRDYLTRVALGVLISIGVGLSVAMISLLIGAPVGVYSAVRGGWIDSSTGRILEVFFAFPQILLALVLVTIVGSGLFTALLVLTLVYIPIVVRFVRNVAMIEARKDYVLSAQLYGCSRFRQCFVHVLPNLWGSLLVLASSICAFAMIAESTLSYLGLGARPPVPSLGILLTENQGFLSTAPHLVLFPAVVLFLLVLSVNQVGDALIDKLDIKRHFVRG
jgi:peptide/nickel transport system permease protein